MDVNNKQYACMLEDGSSYGTYTDLFTITSDGLALNCGKYGIKGLSGTIYAVKSNT